ncbi:hypothetical protein FC36_GL001892 [Ligilactobacillus equi DSM 15833 = JCM 10991]|uniref:Uncharacterized protein n=1 Tax=Ligilactobacillus equi DSM 15833 = JCM 10991 TaxID=1423740 RepID=A0A0R1T643_9LACO|nr:hypothetical protein FC36_GL001892 [Ligilactobacillus equi DSM 15833 = JCM 10991]
MIPGDIGLYGEIGGVPRVYGGDPKAGSCKVRINSVFPVCTGVILKLKPHITKTDCVPRVYGGDPVGYR